MSFREPGDRVCERGNDGARHGRGGDGGEDACAGGRFLWARARAAPPSGPGRDALYVCVYDMVSASDASMAPLTVVAVMLVKFPVLGAMVPMSGPGL